MSDLVSIDLWIEILKRLRPKTLMQCRCVCKGWNSLICSGSFIVTHQDAQSSSSQYIFSSLECSDDFIQFDRKTRVLFDTIKCPFRARFNPICTVNGVLCLHRGLFHPLIDSVQDIILLWNPSINKQIVASKPRYSSADGPCSSFIGFGSSSFKNELKILRLVYLRQNMFVYDIRIPPMAEVYSILERNWRPINCDKINCYPIGTSCSQCFCGEQIYWIAREKNEPLRHVILSFDFKSEQFNIIDLPEELTKCQLKIFKYGSTFPVIEQKGTPSDNVEGIKWVLKKNGGVSSWRKIGKVQYDFYLGLWINANGIAVDVGNDDFLSDDSELGKLEPLNHLSQVNWSADFAVDDFMESLVLLDVESGPGDIVPYM